MKKKGPGRSVKEQFPSWKFRNGETERGIPTGGGDKTPKNHQLPVVAASEEKDEIQKIEREAGKT